MPRRRIAVQAIRPSEHAMARDHVGTDVPQRLPTAREAAASDRFGDIP